jgi:hypothetical protein
MQQIGISPDVANSLLRAAISNTDPEEAEYCLAAARLGLDPYCDAQRYERQILRASETLSDDLLGDFLDAADPARIDSALEWISAARRIIDRPRASRRAVPQQARALRQLRTDATESESFDRLAPWDIGYLQAQSVRAQVAPDNTARFAVDQYVPVSTRADGDPGFRLSADVQRSCHW